MGRRPKPRPLFVKSGGSCSFFEKKEPKKLHLKILKKISYIHRLWKNSLFAQSNGDTVGEATCLPPTNAQNYGGNICSHKNWRSCVGELHEAPAPSNKGKILRKCVFVRGRFVNRPYACPYPNANKSGFPCGCAENGGRQIASPTYANDMEWTKIFSTRLRVWIFIDPLGEIFEVKELFTKSSLQGAGQSPALPPCKKFCKSRGA